MFHSIGRNQGSTLFGNRFPKSLLQPLGLDQELPPSPDETEPALSQAPAMSGRRPHDIRATSRREDNTISPWVG